VCGTQNIYSQSWLPEGNVKAVLLVVHGLGEHSGRYMAEMLYDKASSKDKTIKFYDGLYHEVFNEPERARVLKDVETWLATHI
jgi:lysophospholipase